MNQTIDLVNYHPDIIADTINTIWVGETNDHDLSKYICTMNIDLQDILELEFDSIRILSAVNCGTLKKAKAVLQNLQKLGFTTIPQSSSHSSKSIHNIYLLKYN